MKLALEFTLVFQNYALLIITLGHGFWRVMIMQNKINPCWGDWFLTPGVASGPIQGWGALGFFWGMACALCSWQILDRSVCALCVCGHLLEM